MENSKKKNRQQKPGLTPEEELELERIEKFLFKKGKSVFESEPQPNVSETTVIEKKDRKRAWEDPDDTDLIVSDALAAQNRPKMGVPGKPTDDFQIVLKKRFETRVGNPMWAKLDRKVEDEDELLKHCGNMIDHKKDVLSQGNIQIKRLKPLGKGAKREGPFINSVEFHPSSTVAMVAGSAGVVSLFQVDGNTNPHLQSVRYENFPIRCAHFSQDGNSFIVGSSRQRKYFKYDMMAGKSICVPIHRDSEMTNLKRFEVSPVGNLIAVCGKFGNIHLLEMKTNECIASLKMNGNVTAICFSPDGSQLWSHGDGGEVYVWEVASRKCLHRFVDDGCLLGTSLAISPSNQMIACGSQSGVVNVYKTQDTLQSAFPQPVKAIMNLVTAVTALRFNASSQILALASDSRDGAFKLVHLPSLTILKHNINIPERPISLDFSPGSGYFCIGTNQHTVPLFRLQHFGNY